MRCLDNLACAGLMLLSTVPSAAAERLTFTRDIAPIIRSRCGGCHRPGDLAPFSLLDYRDVRPRARQIAKVTRDRTMPPWLPEPGHGAFAADRRLTDNEVQRIGEWVDRGAPEGDRDDLGPPPEWHDGWALGTPDLVVSVTPAYTIQPGGADLFRNFVIPLPLGSIRYVRGIEVRPGNRRVVHHASIAIDRTRSSRRLDEADPEPGYAGGMFNESAQSPDSRALGWTPGITPALEAPGMAWRLEPGSDLVLLLHLMPPQSGLPQPVQPTIGLYFSDDPPNRTPIDFKLGSKAIDIPAGKSDYAVEDHYTTPVDVDVLSIYPHAHYLAREMKVWATLPDGSEQGLLWIRNWDFRWQDQYRYRVPVSLRRGTVITMRYTYDNSAGNKRNPATVPRRVRYGPESSDEMGDLWLRLLPHSHADAVLLARSYGEHQLAKDIARGEQLIAVEPAAARWRNVLGAAYVESGRIIEGVAQLEEALRLAPDHVEAHNNLARARQLQGDIAAAIAGYREAARLAPFNEDILVNFANALQDNGDMANSLALLERVLALNPARAEAHNNLGVALASLGRFDEAIGHFQAALAIRPDDADATGNLAQAVQLRGTPGR